MKTTRKWNPIQIYDIAAMEHWLEEMAGDGLLAVDFGPLFVEFEKSQLKPRRRYRLDANPKFYGNEFYDDPEPQILELYEQAGWTFVGDLWNKSFFVYCSDDPFAVEPYTDPPSRALSLRTLQTNCQNTAIVVCAALFIAAAGLFFRLMSATVLGALPLLTAAPPLAWLINLLYTCRTLHTIRRMRDWLEAGRPLEGFQFQRTRSPFARVRRTIYLLFVIAALAEGSISLLYQRTTPLEQAELDFSILQLAELEGPDYVPDPHETEISVMDYSFYPPTPVTETVETNCVKTYWRPLAPRCYTISQSGTADGGAASLTIEYYILRSPQLAVRTMEELAGNAAAAEVPGTDDFRTAKYRNILYAARGNRVLTVWYTGPADLSGFYDEIAAMLAVS